MSSEKRKEEARDIIEVLTGEQPEVKFDWKNKTFRQKSGYTEKEVERGRTPVKEIKEVILNQDKYRAAEDKIKGKKSHTQIDGPWKLTENEKEFAEHVYKQGIHHIQARNLRERDLDLNDKEMQALRTLHTGQADAPFQRKNRKGLKNDADMYMEIIDEEPVEMQAARMKILGRNHYIEAINMDGEINTFAAKYKSDDYDNQLNEIASKHHKEGRSFTEYLPDFTDDDIDHEKLVNHIIKDQREIEEGLDRVSKHHYPDLRVRRSRLERFLGRLSGGMI